MKPSKLYEALHALIGERVPLHIWGPCGVGKSQIVGQVAADLDYNFLDIRAVQLDPVDLRGLPRIASDQTEWVPPKFLPTTGKGILFLDELTSAPQMTQAGCYQLVLDRKLGEYVLRWSGARSRVTPACASCGFSIVRRAKSHARVKRFG
jgi:MoxR-like ATPase